MSQLAAAELEGVIDCLGVWQKAEGGRKCSPRSGGQA